MRKPVHQFARFFHRPRLMTSALVGVLVLLALIPFMPASRAILIAFNTAATVFLGLMAVLMSRATPQTMRHRALLQNEGKRTVLFISLCIAGVVLGALSSELHAAKDKSIGDIALASSSILLSWLFVAVMFAQQYAHSFYMKAGLLVFPGTEHPDYWDFTYFSVVLSMCCQTSDVTVASSSMRRLAMLHSVISFFFNVIIIAISVNVAAGMF